MEADGTGCCNARGARAQPRRSNSRHRRSTHDDERTSVECEGAPDAAAWSTAGRPRSTCAARGAGSGRAARGCRCRVGQQLGPGPAQLQHQGAHDARAAAGMRARGWCAGVHGASIVRRRGARVRRQLVGAGPPASSRCLSRRLHADELEWHAIGERVGPSELRDCLRAPQHWGDRVSRPYGH